MPLKIDFVFRGDETSRFKIKDGWDRAGQEGEYFGNVMVNGREWALVLFDGEEDPVIQKSESLLTWNSLTL